MVKPFTALLARPEGTGTSTRFTVPFNVEEVFGARGRVAIRGKIDGHPFQGSLMPRDGRHIVIVNKEIRDAIGKEAGDSVLVEIERDDQPRVLSIPEALSRAIARNEAARAVFEGLSYSHRKEFADWIDEAKKPETRDRRVEKAVEMLVVGRKGIKGQPSGS